jgi:hypothetical protein
MISLSDSLLATGATLTFHYTHPSRDVAMQIALAMRLDFTEPSPKNLMRASVFFTSYVSNGQKVDLLSSGRAQPQFRAGAVSEVSGELIADNCELSAVVSQFDQSGGGGAALVTVSILKIVFAQTAGGPPIYTHIVKTWPGGRVVAEQEAKATALANAAVFAIDVSQANVAVSRTLEQG